MNINFNPSKPPKGVFAQLLTAIASIALSVFAVVLLSRAGRVKS